MTVWIVYNPLKLDEIEVFTDEQAAINHRKNLAHKWKLTAMIEREVLGI